MSFDLVDLEQMIGRDLIRLGRGKVISKKDIAALPGAYPIYSSARLNNGKFGEYGEYMFDEELITWSVDGGGNFFYRPRHRFSVTNVGGTLKILDKNSIDCKYLFHILCAKHERLEFDWTQKAHPSVIRRLYKEIPLPPLADQKRIAGILDAADALRTKRREALAQLDTLIQSTFLDMFGDPVTNPMGWEVARLDQVCDRVIDCPHSTPKWTDSGVICLRTSNLGCGDWDWTDTRYVSENEYRERTKRSEIEPDDIILSREGTVGVLALVEKGMRICMGQRLVQLRASDSVINPRFLVHLLLHDLAPVRVGKLMAGSTSKHLNVKELRRMPVLSPPLTLQHRFATIVESIEQQKYRMRAHLAELDALFASLQSRAFNGEL